MEARETKTDDAVKIELTLTPEEYDNLSNAVRSKIANATAGGQKWCCTCIPSGKQHEYRESNDILAYLKCGIKCGGSFQLSKGDCGDDVDVDVSSDTSKAACVGCDPRGRANPDQIKYAASSVGLQLSDAQIQTLTGGKNVPMSNVERSASAMALCSGIKIYDFGNGCGLYLTFSGLISYCCEF